MITTSFIAFLAAAILVALVDWRRGWLLALIVGVLQDPARKMTPGTPVVMTFSVVLVFFTILFAAQGTMQNYLRDLARRFPRLVGASALVLIFLLVAAANGLATFGIEFWKVPALSLFIYVAPATAIVLGYAYTDSEDRIVHYLQFYSSVTAIALIGTPLEYFKLQWSALGMVALPEGFIRHLPGIQIRILSGFYRAPDIMGWHAAMLTCTGILLALRARELTRAWPWMLVAGWGFLNCILSGRRKATYMVAVFVIAFVWRYIRRLEVRQLALFIALGAVLATVVYRVSASEESSVYAKGTVISSDEVFQRLQGGILETFEEFGWLGAGLGTATQGVRHLTGQDINVGWQEGGLGKFAVELGLPGLLAVAAAAWTLVRVMLRMTAFGDDVGTSQMMRAGLFAIFIANVVEFMVSAQAYSDAVLTLVTAFLLGAFLATARLDPKDAPFLQDAVPAPREVAIA